MKRQDSHCGLGPQSRGAAAGSVIPRVPYRHSPRKRESTGRGYDAPHRHSGLDPQSRGVVLGPSFLAFLTVIPRESGNLQGGATMHRIVILDLIQNP